MKHITTEDALRALEEAVAEKGEDYVYPGVFLDGGADCRYLEDDERTPSCIAGNALLRLGVDPADIWPFNEGTDVHELIHDLDLSVQLDAARALYAAQGTQDGGAKWGEALAAAREVVES